MALNVFDWFDFSQFTARYKATKFAYPAATAQEGSHLWVRQPETSTNFFFHAPAPLVLPSDCVANGMIYVQYEVRIFGWLIGADLR